MIELNPKELLTIAQAARYAHLHPHTIYEAVQRGRIKAHRGTKWWVSREAIDDYRANKYNRDNRTFNGEKIHDMEKDRWSVLHASKVLSTMLKKQISAPYIYQLIRKGKIEAQKANTSWVLPKTSLEKIYHMKTGHNPNQMAFA